MRILETARDYFRGPREYRDATRRLTESVRLFQHKVQETLASLELELEQEGWSRLGGPGDREFSKEAVKNIRRLSRRAWMKNPLINRSVCVQALYVFGQGMTLTSEDTAAQKVLDSFMQSPANRAAFTGHQARMMLECLLQVQGCLYLQAHTELVKGGVQVRMLCADEIVDVIRNPEDAAEICFYKRVYQRRVDDLDSGAWSSSEVTEYYPDIAYMPADRRPAIGGKPVHWDRPVHYVRVGCLADQEQGLPETYQSLDWAGLYKSFLEDWASLTKALRRFAYNVKMPGGAKSVEGLRQTLDTLLNGDETVDRNPSPNVGSIFAASKAELNPIKTAGATSKPEEGRPIRNMVAAGSGLPETFYGDMDTANLATAKSLDRPTELKFLDRQKLWADVFEEFGRYAVRQSSRAPGGEGELRGAETTPKVTANFPPILEHDITQTIGAIISAATLDGKTPAGTMDDETIARQLLEALGVKNADQVILKAKAEKEARKEEAAAIAKAAPRAAVPPAPEKEKEAA